MRVAYLIDSLGAGGSERSLTEMLPHLLAAGVEPRVFVLSEPGQSFADQVRDQGIEVDLVPPVGWLRRRAYLRRQLDSWRADLLHTTLFYSDVLGRLAAWGSRVPVVTSLVSVRYEPTRLEDPKISPWRFRTVQWIDGFTGRHLNAHFHAVSQAVKDSAVARLGLAPEVVTVVQRGRDAERFGAIDRERRAAARRHWKVADDELLLVNVGRQTFHKAQLVLLDAVRAMRRTGRPVRLIIAGRKGPCSDDLARFIGENRLEECVQAIEHVDDIPGLLAAADIFAFASRLEGFPGAVLEAMAMGLPVVATDIPALREIFRTPDEAPLVAPGSAEELTKELERLAEDTEIRRRLGQRNREIFLERFDIRKTVPGILDLYRKVTANGSPG